MPIAKKPKSCLEEKLIKRARRPTAAGRRTRPAAARLVAPPPSPFTLLPQTVRSPKSPTEERERERRRWWPNGWLVPAPPPPPHSCTTTFGVRGGEQAQLPVEGANQPRSERARNQRHSVRPSVSQYDAGSSTEGRQRRERESLPRTAVVRRRRRRRKHLLFRRRRHLRRHVTCDFLQWRCCCPRIARFLPSRGREEEIEEKWR